MRKHPIVEFVKFIALLTILCITQHPIVIIILFITSLLLHYKMWIVDLWLIVITTFIYSISNVGGVTFLAYRNSHIVSKEGIIYGFFMGVRLAAILNIARTFSKDVRSEKLVIVTSYLFPQMSILISMTVRSVTRYTNKLKEIYWIRTAGEPDKHLISKIKVGLESLSILIDWALENGIETAKSMTYRKYGTCKRTSYIPVTLSYKDIMEVTVIIFTGVLLLVTIPEYEYIPYFRYQKYGIYLLPLLSLGVYAVREEYLESKNK